MRPHQAILWLIEYALQNNLLDPLDRVYAYNRLLDLLQVEHQEDSPVLAQIPEEPSRILEPLLDHAVAIGLIEIDTVKQRDIFEAKIMDIVLPRPSQVTQRFVATTKDDPKKQTDYFYTFSQKSNYIKTSRTSKNIVWTSNTDYGQMDITINLSKPEKDPKDIILQGKSSTKDRYPACLLCVDNVGYNGLHTGVGRSSHRIVPVTLNNEPFYFQYSPYVYYNEHCIVLHEDHIPMNVTKATFIRLFDFIDQFPHYFLGSNAGLPIVGGSILAHEHYQGGNYHFAIEDATVLRSFEQHGVTFEQLHWPLSVVRLRSAKRERVIEEAYRIYLHWEQYSNEALGIYSHTGDTPHNAITPIARMKDGQYELDLTLRNNRTTDAFPLGVFHPHPEHHHIKKENIGLIEVMGLAVLPARLVEELEDIKTVLERDIEIPDSIAHHAHWITELKDKRPTADLDALLRDEVAIKFTKVLEDAGVFKQDNEGIKAFHQFLLEVEHGPNT